METIVPVDTGGELAVAVVVAIPQEVVDTALDLDSGEAVDSLGLSTMTAQAPVSDHPLPEVVQSLDHP